MKSIKPGRGPSKMSFAGSMAAIAFGILWTVLALGLGSSFRGLGDPTFSLVGTVFPFLGLVFIGLGIAQAVYHYRNAYGAERHTIVDIVDSREEGDPGDLNRRFCPACGGKLPSGARFCPTCGQKQAP